MLLIFILNHALIIFMLGSYSPRLMQGKDLPPDVVIINAAEDQLTMDGKRRLLSKTGATTSGQEDAFIKRAKEGMDTQEEATFAVEAPINQQVGLLKLNQNWEFL